MYFLTFIGKNLTRRRARTVLTVLGLSVAVGSVVALLGIAQNFYDTMAKTFDRRGVDLIVMAAGKADQLSSEIDQSVTADVAKLPGVVSVSETLVDIVEVTRGRTSDSVIAQGWTADNFAYDDIEMIAGRKLTDTDGTQAMLGSKLADSLEKTIGDTVELQGEPFEVVGVYRSFDMFENGAVVVPLPEMQRLSAREGSITALGVRVDTSGTDDPNTAVDAVRGKIEAFNRADGRGVKLSAQSAQDYMDSAAHLQLTEAMAWMVSAIAILIGVISMLNTMFMSVLERTQEIGILRAIGWPPIRVVKMIMGEALLLSLLAAVVGTIGAVGLTYALSKSPKVQGFIEPGVAPIVVVQGVAITVAIGLLGGLYPAIRAARLLPTEAIRHD